MLSAIKPVSRWLKIIAITVLAGETKAQQVPSRHCGAERWSVKILADSDAHRVKTDSIVETDIATLNGIPIPEIAYPQNRRIAPHELTVYRVTAFVTDVITESDGDWHVVLRQTPTSIETIIAEIPSPRCTQSAQLRIMFEKARENLKRNPQNQQLVIEGVGFFDFIHNQRGRARNGFEIHPVLNVLPLHCNQSTYRHPQCSAQR